MAALFHFFKPFLLFLFCSLYADLVEGRFPKFSFSADSTRCGCVCLFRCFTFLCIQNLLVFPVSCWLLVLSASWMQMVTGIWTFEFVTLIFGYVNPSADPWTPSSHWTLLNIVNWILISSLPFWMEPEEIFFPIFRRTTDVQQFVKDFCFHQSQTWWVPADYVGLVIGIVNIVNYSAESNQTNSIAFCLNFYYQRILKRELILHYFRYTNGSLRKMSANPKLNSPFIQNWQ